MPFIFVSVPISEDQAGGGHKRVRSITSRRATQASASPSSSSAGGEGARPRSANRMARHCQAWSNTPLHFPFDSIGEGPWPSTPPWCACWAILCGLVLHSNGPRMCNVDPPTRSGLLDQHTYPIGNTKRLGHLEAEGRRPLACGVDRSRRANRRTIDTTNPLSGLTERDVWPQELMQAQKDGGCPGASRAASRTTSIILLTAILGSAELPRHSLVPAPSEREEVEESARRHGGRRTGRANCSAFSRQQVIAPRVLNPNECAPDDKMLRRCSGRCGEKMRTVLASDLGALKVDPSHCSRSAGTSRHARDAMPMAAVDHRTQKLELDQIRARTTCRRIRVLTASLRERYRRGMTLLPHVRIFEPSFLTTDRAGLRHGTSASPRCTASSSKAAVGLGTRAGHGTSLQGRPPRLAESAIPHCLDPCPRHP